MLDRTGPIGDNRDMKTHLPRRARTIVCVVFALALLAPALGCEPAPTGSRSASNEGGAAVSGDGVAASRDPSELRIAIAGMVVPRAGLAYYKGLADYVGQRVGKRVRLVHKADYATVNEMLEQRRLDMAFVCSGPYVTGHDAFGLELLVAPEVDGKTTYQSYIIAPLSSDATSLASLRGKTFAFTDPQSNSGRIVPTYLLARMGTTPDAFFKEYFYTYSHDNSIKAVATGRADGAAVDSLIWEYESATNPAFTKRTRIVERSDQYGIPPVVVHPATAPRLKRALRDAFLGADGTPEGKALLDKMRIERFVTVTDSHYDSIRQMEAWIAGHAKP
jgi:phosphonate transport system substrate-binding protein